MGSSAVRRRRVMKKENEKKDRKKAKYTKPVLTKHNRLRDITAGAVSRMIELGCTKW
jgi:hypothetical protein